MPSSQISFLSPIEPPAGHDLTLKGGDGVGDAAQVLIGMATDPNIVLTPGASEAVEIEGAASISGVLSSSLTTNATSTSTGAARFLGGVGIAKNVWVGEQLAFPATGTSSAVGIIFGTSSEALFRSTAGSLRMTGLGGFEISMDVLPTATSIYNLGSSGQRWLNLYLASNAFIGNDCRISGELSVADAVRFAKSPNYVNNSGVNNAITVTLLDSSGTEIPQSAGLRLSVILSNSLQAGANTLALNNGTAKSIKSHRNPANNISTAYAVGGIIDLMYDGTQYQDMSQ